MILSGRVNTAANLESDSSREYNQDLLWRVGLENREKTREPNLPDALNEKGVTRLFNYVCNFFFLRNVRRYIKQR